MLSNRHSCQLIVLIALVGATHRLGSRRSRKRQAIARQSEPRWEQPPRAMLADLTMTTAIPEAMKKGWYPQLRRELPLERADGSPLAWRPLRSSSCESRISRHRLPWPIFLPAKP